MILICVALEKELPNEFKQTYSEYWIRSAALRSGGGNAARQRPFVVLITGVGESSGLALMHAIDFFKPVEIVNVGTAGSAAFPLHQWVMLNQLGFKSEWMTCHYQTALPIPYHTFKPASGRTVTHLGMPLDGEVIDMEAYFLAVQAKRHAIPFVSFKFITDANNQHTQRDFSASLPVFKTEFMNILRYVLSGVNCNSKHAIQTEVFSASDRVNRADISVVIPVYNRQHPLQRAIQSVQQQTVPPKEIIVVDDGSFPCIKCDDPTIILHRSSSNVGVSHARNLGIRQASSPWIAFLDSDDTWETRHLEVLISYLNQNPLCRWLQSNEKWVRHGKHFNKKLVHTKPSGWAFGPSLQRCLVSPSAVMIHRSLFDWFGTFDESLTACEDYDLWLRFLRFSPVGLAQETTVTKYGGHSDQLSMMTPVLDSFRVRSLIQLLEKPLFDCVRPDILCVLKQKLAILIQGAKKRQLNKDVDFYETILNWSRRMCENNHR
jgi:GT2 family glycosyltransferase